MAPAQEDLINVFLRLQLWSRLTHVRIAREDRAPTILDVAKAAGVSLPTVSRVLTGSTPVSDKKRELVLAAMKELGYRPNGAARALVQGRQPIVGVLTEDVTSFGATRMIRSIEEQARRAGYVVAVAVMDPSELDETGSALEVLLGQPIVGVVVLDFHRYNQESLLERLAGVSITTVTSDDEAGFRHVVIDDRRAARELTEYLLSLGHRTVHHVSVPGNNGRLHPREVGWREALRAAGAPVPDPIQTDWSIESGRQAGAALARDRSVTAVLCANDELAFGVMRSLRDAGLSIPEDVSVAGMDDQPLADAWVPGLTSYRLDFDWAGAAALRLLLQPKRSRVAPDSTSFRLVPRGTTAAPNSAR